MNKKLVTLIIVILISFCFIGIVVAHNNTTHVDNNDTDHHEKTIDNKSSDKNESIDNDTDNKTKDKYILAQGSGNNIKFSDGFTGFILDYSKSPASSGDEFKRASASKAPNSNTLKLAIIESYKLDSSGQIGQIMEDFVKTGSSNSKVGQAVAASHEKIGNHAVVKINDKTEAIFDFEVLESVSGNESDYFAYTVSFRTINNVNQTHNITNITNTTNITNATNITNMTGLLDNLTDLTLLMELYEFLLYFADLLYDAWEPIIETLINDFLMFINALEEMVNWFEHVMAEIQSLIDALEKLINMLDQIWKELDGLLKLLTLILHALQQLINLIGYVLNLIMALINTIISLIQQLLALLAGLINFIMDLINQLVALIQAILNFLKAVGSFLINVVENARILIGTFVLITIGLFVFDRIRR